MSEPETFDIRAFLPYLLNLASEETSIKFSEIYKSRYNLLRTEWRVLFHLGRYGDMTATDIGSLAKIHKTKISRAVHALEKKRFLKRTEMDDDRRREILSLMPKGQTAYADLSRAAETYNHELSNKFSAEEWRIVCKCLERLARLPTPVIE